jgi:Zn-dependent peptidase ImmA (M78 family)/transcriptional regulator with XRE-family HTH domain
MHGNADMLRLARQRRAFQQVEAARLLAIDQSFLSRIENGLVEVREDFLLKAAQVYDLPVSFFHLREPVYGAPVSVHPMWRKKADVTAREMDCVIAELNFRVMHLRRFFEGAAIKNTSDLPRMDIEEYSGPEEIAALVRAHWRVPAGPIRNLTLLAEKAGALVVHSPLGGASISGVTFAVPGMPPLIVLNSDQPSDRMRFSLAHELAHIIMHRFPTPNMEQEANAFAVALLMPAPDIRPYFLGRRIDLALLASLKPEWRVSMAALLMRAHKLKFLTDNQHTYLWKQISARGYRLREPPELDFESEQPEVLNQIIQLHLEALGYTASDLSKLLCIHEREFRSLYGLAGSGTPKRARLTILK